MTAATLTLHMEESSRTVSEKHAVAVRKLASVDTADAEVEHLWLIGSDGALRAAYDQFSPVIYTYCLRRLGDQESATECTQDVFVSAWRSREQYSASQGRLIAWMMGIAKFRVVDALRARARTPVPVADPTMETEPVSTYGDDHLADRLLINHAIGTLEPRARGVIELAYFSALTHSEIVNQTGLPLGTVKSDIRRGLQRMREVLEGGEENVR